MKEFSFRLDGIGKDALSRRTIQFREVRSARETRCRDSKRAAKKLYCAREQSEYLAGGTFHWNSEHDRDRGISILEFEISNHPRLVDFLHAMQDVPGVNFVSAQVRNLRWGGGPNIKQGKRKFSEYKVSKTNVHVARMKVSTGLLTPRYQRYLTEEYGRVHEIYRPISIKLVDLEEGLWFAAFLLYGMEANKIHVRWIAFT